MRTLKRRAVAVGTAAALVGLLATACSGGSTTDDAAAEAPTLTQEEIDAAMSTPTELTFWTWVADMDDEVALFEAKYPAIKVKVENAGQGGDEYTKLRTALEAGKGAPDVVQVEYQQIPSFTITDSLLDLSAYGAAELEADYTPWVWNQVSRDGHVYALPQDAGPVGTLYRQDLFEQAGITEPPATWAEFADAARQVKDTTGAYITNAPSDPAQLISLLWQAGVKPFGYDGKETVDIAVNGDDVKAVLDYWQGLIQDDLVAVDPGFTDQWYQGIANGTYASWLTAAWGPMFLQGTAGDTAGSWRAAPLPQWSAGESSTGNWGGSSNAVVATSENPIAAYELAKFINNDLASTSLLASQQFLFPTSEAVLESPEFADQEPEFFGGQQVNKVFAEIGTTVDTEFGWLPFMDYAVSAFSDTVGKAMSEKADLSAAADAWQDKLVTYAKAQGFTVAE